MKPQMSLITWLSANESSSDTAALSQYPHRHPRPLSILHSCWRVWVRRVCRFSKAENLDLGPSSSATSLCIPMKSTPTDAGFGERYNPQSVAARGILCTNSGASSAAISHISIASEHAHECGLEPWSQLLGLEGEPGINCRSRHVPIPWQPPEKYLVLKKIPRERLPTRIP